MMTTTKDTYHHGDLKRALMDGALAVIAENGVAGLSLRQVAAEIGVSHAAPYHHFADKAALLQALATDGMRRMDERMAAAEEAAGDDPVDRLVAIGMAYVLFADERPDYYAALTAPELAAPASAPPAPDSQPEGGTWERLVRAIVVCQQAGRLPAGDPVVLAVTMWSLVHGLAELWQGGPLRYMPQGSQGLEPLARAVLGAAVGSMQAAAASGGPAGTDKGDRR